MQKSRIDIESKRTTALALWRYSHDYLRTAHTLCETDLIACDESQVVYHLAAQGIEFALKSHLRARGLTPEDLSARIGHSLLDALQEAIARDLSPPPAEVARAIRFIAPYHRKDEFRYLGVSYGKFPHLAPLLAAGTWILGEVVEVVVTDYFLHHGNGTETDRRDMRRRLHIDLGATMSKVVPGKYPAAWS
ncbi:MAG: hypothetical protein ACM338_00040 [Betaproteobacteria bacterium]